MCPQATPLGRSICVHAQCMPSSSWGPSSILSGSWSEKHHNLDGCSHLSLHATGSRLACMAYYQRSNFLISDPIYFREICVTSSGYIFLEKLILQGNFCFLTQGDSAGVYIFSFQTTFCLYIRSSPTKCKLINTVHSDILLGNNATASMSCSNKRKKKTGTEGSIVLLSLHVNLHLIDYID